jgi:hypothetical protein
MTSYKDFAPTALWLAGLATRADSQERFLPLSDLIFSRLTGRLPPLL